MAQAPPRAVASGGADLLGVCREATTGDHPFFGTAQVPALEAQLAAVGDDPALLGRRVRLLGALGRELIRVGRRHDALARIEAARALATAGQNAASVEPTVRGQLLFDLALTHLLLAEEANCLAAHNAESCILPLAPGGLHRQPAAARRAGDLFLQYLELHPDAVQARWLLHVARLVSGDFPSGVPAPWRVPEGTPWAAPPAPTRWRDVAPSLGLAVRDLSGGAVMDDLDGDGLLDLITTTWDPCGAMKAFRNDGRGGFTEVTRAWGLEDQLGGLALMQVDYDGDGALDLLVLRGAWLGHRGKVRNSLLRNELKAEAGRFVDVTVRSGLAFPAYPTQAAAWADFDGDGDLDVYIGNESDAGNPAVAGFRLETGRAHPSQLFRNNGDGTFTDIARAAGVTNREFAKAASWGDYDDDGDPDLFVSNIGPDRLYRNNGDGTFTDVAADAGLAGSPEVSFTGWFFDADNDGREDLLVTDYGTRFERISAGSLGLLPPVNSEHRAEGAPALFRNVGGGRFADVSARAGLDSPALPMGANFGDLDNDGWLDIYLGTGVPDFSALMPNVMLRNVSGTRFEDVTFPLGLGHLQKGHGVAWGDLDQDGDQDLFEQMGGAYPFDAYANALYENPGASGHAWVTLRFQGAGKNPFAVGARVEVKVTTAGGATRSIHRTVGAGSSHGGPFGASSLQEEIGLGDAEQIQEILVRWPSGQRSRFPGVPTRSIYRATEGAANLVALPATPFRLASDRPAAHSHHP